MKVQRPIAIQLPPCGVLVAQSAHEHGFAMEDEAHDFYELYYLLDGTAEYYEPNIIKPIPLAAGDVVPIAPGRSHRIADLRPSTLLLLCLAPSFISFNPERLALWRALEARGHAPIHTDAAARERLEKYLRRILAEQSAPRPAAGLSIQSTADQFLVELARLPDIPFAPGASARVAGLLRELEQSFFEAWTLDKAAARTRLSRRRFSELFRQTAGDTFQRTLARLRVEHAARLMREGGQSIAAAAFASGFGDLSHFYRVFKEHHGHPPGRFLRTPNK
jgi:AraC-like DNA-binding protein